MKIFSFQFPLKQDSHCVKSLQIRSFLVRIFLYSDGIRSTNTGKYGPENTLYLETFHAIAFCRSDCVSNSVTQRLFKQTQRKITDRESI